MQREITKVEQDYAALNQKIDIICDAVTKFVKLYERLSSQLTQLSTMESKNFGELFSLLKELKDLSIKPIYSSLITPEFLSQKFV